ncbi:MAG: alpha/beta hydrolase [Chloroflexi bacterium]|nr:alpha/beta hydrolase [Chloroflexota bacterium]
MAIAPEQLRYREETTARSEAVRKEYTHELGIKFGAHERQTLDLYYPKRVTGPAPVFVFLHGGGFRGGSPTTVAYMGEALLKHGAMFIAMTYRLMPEVKYPDMGDDVELGLEWVLKNIHGCGGNEDKVYLSGHSAGATLAALLGLRAGWLKDRGLPDDLVKGLVLISGGYINRREGDDVNTASKHFVGDLSRSFERAPAHTILATAENDLPQCQPSAEALEAALKAKGASVEFLSKLRGYDHFFVGHELANEDGAIFAAAKRMLNLL